MRKLVYIIIGIGIFIIIGAVVYFLLSSRQTPLIPSSTPEVGSRVVFPQSSISPVSSLPPSEYIFLQKGNTEVRNFYKSSNYVSENGAVLQQVEKYNITFDAEQERFYIVIDQQDINEARGQAEEYLEKTLGVSREKLCSLDVLLYVDKSVDPSRANIDYGISFCPYGKPF